MHGFNAKLRAQRLTKAKETGKDAKKQNKAERLEQYLANRDFTGAMALLEFQRKIGKQIERYPTLPWLGYALFHLGEYDKAAEVYQEMIAKDSEQDPSCQLYYACCLYHLGDYRKCYETVRQCPPSPLQARLLLHVAQRLGLVEEVKAAYSRIGTTIADKLTVAAHNCLTGHYQEALNEYSTLRGPDRAAINVYLAFCYFKLQFDEAASQHVDVYLALDPDSPTARNLKACTACRMYSPNAGLVELQPLLEQSGGKGLDNVLVRHNLVVFSNGDRALQVLPPLVGVIPEARLNLIIFYINNNMISEAYDLVNQISVDRPDATVSEKILKAVVLTHVAQRDPSRTDAMAAAQHLFQTVGSSEHDRDTIPGRQAMASYFFLKRSFDDAYIYLDSIREFLSDDDTFLYNFGIVLANCTVPKYQQARQCLLRVKDPRITKSHPYIATLLRCTIHCRDPKRAWELYVKHVDVAESYHLAQMIARECYRVGLFLYALKAYDVLYRLEASEEYWMGKRGAVIGTLYQVIAGEEPPETLKEAYLLLSKTIKNTGLGQSPPPEVVEEVAQISRVIQNYARQKGITLN